MCGERAACQLTKRYLMGTGLLLHSPPLTAPLPTIIGLIARRDFRDAALRIMAPPGPITLFCKML